MDFPTLYKKTSTGATQTWKISVMPSFDIATIRTEYGQLGGKMQVGLDQVGSGKNLGKANETTAFEQACAEAQSQWEKKLKNRGYVESLEDAKLGKIDTNFITGGVEPMLAHTYEKQGHKIKFPAFAQPKLDGHRCIAIIQDGKCTLWSRTRKPITGVPHIQRALESIWTTGTLILDGELYNHNYKDNFEDLTSFIRQENPKPGHEVVQYWVYDVVEGGDFQHRLDLLTQMEPVVIERGLSNVINILPTFRVESEEEMIETFGVFINEGYEGLMIRNAKGLYVNKRSYDLQKVKVMQDTEYLIVDVVEGRGKMAGKAIFVCQTPEGKTFNVKMMGALDNLATVWENRESYIGEELTVKYQNLSSDGIPRFPVGLRVKEDL